MTKLRTEAELMTAFAEDPRLKELYDAFKADPRLEVIPNGTGTAYFKVYLRGRTGSKQGFLRVLLPMESCYIDWSQYPELGRAAFADVAQTVYYKGTKKPLKDGRGLKPDASSAELIMAVNAFADGWDGSTEAGANGDIRSDTRSEEGTNL